MICRVDAATDIPTHVLTHPAMSGFHYRADGAETARPGITEQFGIACGTVAAWADEMGTTPDLFLKAADDVRAVPLVDTAQHVGRSGGERPTCPTLRHLAFNRRDVARILQAVTPEPEPLTMAA